MGGRMTALASRLPLRVRRRPQAVRLYTLRDPARLPTWSETREWIGALLIVGGGLWVLGTALWLVLEGM
jgi:hypothetical protein